MAIAFGGVSSVSTSQTPTSVSVSGSDTIGIVYVVGDSAGDNITAVTWDGSAMTKINAVQTPSDRYSSVWYIVNPSAGASTISFTGGSFWRSYSMFYTGADQSSPLDSSNTNTTASGTSLSTTNTVINSDCWLIYCVKDGGGNRTDTASDDVSSVRVSADAGGIGIADSNGTVATGSRTATMSISGAAVQIAGIAFAIQPSAAATTFIPKVMIF